MAIQHREHRRRVLIRQRWQLDRCTPTATVSGPGLGGFGGRLGPAVLTATFPDVLDRDRTGLAIPKRPSAERLAHDVMEFR